jgi:hypothetical protein
MSKSVWKIVAEAHADGAARCAAANPSNKNMQRIAAEAAAAAKKTK